MDMHRLKPIAIYLPQFHRVKENDEWWGEGFTDWVALKQAESLFEGHMQPRVPLNENYYDLNNYDTMLWQAELAKKYGIYGFCFYHYYFANGRKILEKPAENFLKWKDININFCFSWANETWARTWSGVKGATDWGQKFNQTHDSSDGILLLQEYGDRKDWEEHFEYLLPFFQDDRYIKVNNCPVFMFHKADKIEVLDRMLEVWNELAQKEGFGGIYSIARNTGKEVNTDALIIQGPNSGTAPAYGQVYVNWYHENNTRCCDYDNVWLNALCLKNELIEESSQDIMYGGFVDYDDTIRRGESGYVIRGGSPEKFKKYLRAMAYKNMANNQDMLFINAWNEWGESNYLEPDTYNQFGYLEAIRDVVDELDDKNIDIIKENKEIYKECLFDYHERYQQKILENYFLFKNNSVRYGQSYRLMEKWYSLCEKKVDPSTLFDFEKDSTVAIYGWDKIGRHLYGAIKKIVNVKYVVVENGEKDRYKSNLVTFCNTVEEIPNCDVIIVATIVGRDDIVNQIKNNTKAKIITLWDIIIRYDL